MKIQLASCSAYSYHRRILWNGVLLCFRVQGVTYAKTKVRGQRNEENSHSSPRVLLQPSQITVCKLTTLVSQHSDTNLAVGEV